MAKRTAYANSVSIYTKADLQYFQQLILTHRKNARRDIIYLRSQLRSGQELADNDSAYGFHLAGAAKRAMEREKMCLFISRKQKYIQVLDSALNRIQNGTYGICRITGKRISKKRLEASPHTDLSMTAKLEYC